MGCRRVNPDGWRQRPRHPPVLFICIFIAPVPAFLGSGSCRTEIVASLIRTEAAFWILSCAYFMLVSNNLRSRNHIFGLRTLFGTPTEAFIYLLVCKFTHGGGPDDGDSKAAREARPRAYKNPEMFSG